MSKKKKKKKNCNFKSQFQLIFYSVIAFILRPLLKTMECMVPRSVQEDFAFHFCIPVERHTVRIQIT